MNYKILFYILCLLLLFPKVIVSDEIIIDSSKVKVLDEGNIISALDVKAKIPGKKIEIEGDKSIYDKTSSQLTIINMLNFSII